MTTAALESVLTAGNATVHLTPERWAAANRHVVRKALAEFSHERILTPEPLGPDPACRGAGPLPRHQRRRLRGVPVFGPETGARPLVHRGHVHPPPRGRGHIPTCPRQRPKNGHVPRGRAELDALRFITEFRDTLGIREEMLPVYLEEISSTLSSHAYKQWMGQPSSAELAAGVTGGADAAIDFQTIERSMTEGHPCFVANNGRLGFGIADYRSFAPEAGAPVQLEWIAVHRNQAVFTSAEGLSYRNHLDAELGASAVAYFDAELGVRGLDPADYFLMPVHPWQWDNKLTVTFAAEIAQQRIVHLGIGADSYQAQQSIRTFFNTVSPEKCYVKTAMSVLNMGFMRGLSPQYMKATPAINDWLRDLILGDPALQKRRLTLIREVAAIGYHNGYYEAASAKDSPYRKMLSALWRESPVPLLEDGQQLATMASLLHVDAAGRPMVSALIERSGLAPADVAAPVLRGVSRPAGPLPLCLRAGVYAARRKRHPDSGGRRPGQRRHEGHR